MTRPIPSLLAAWAVVVLSLAPAARTQDAVPVGAMSAPPAHAIAMHGDLKYGADFRHFDYVNPNAPKGGTVRLAGFRTFDTLNPFTLRGVPGAGSTLPFDTLMTASADEPFSEYGLLAESVETPPDRSWVVFNLRREARFHDGRPVTAEDVVWTFNTLIEKGHPRFRFYYGGVDRAVAEGMHRVRFTFKPGLNRELPLILGQLPVLAKHHWEERDFERTSLVAPLGSGPYRVAGVEPNRSITYERVPDYWARDLPVNVGRHNFDRIRYDYYRDETVAVEALKAGAFDFRAENVARFWASAYDVPAARRGFLRKEFIGHGQPTGMQGFVFNTRRPIFSDRRVRRALAYAFDYEWTNRVLFHGAYARTASYFSNSELAATGLPGPGELKLLEPFRDRLPEEVFARPYEPPATDGTHEGLRANLLKGLALLDEAGWEVREGRLVNRETGQPMRFEILLDSPSFERIVLPFIGNLRRLGVEATVRTVDASQYINRRRNFDFDMMVHVWGQSLSPGNEQYDYWSSETAKVPGSFNLAGIGDPVVDGMIEAVIRADDRESLVTATRALDRVLLWGHYVIPQWHITGSRLVFWNKFGYPETAPVQGYQFDTWWVDPARDAALAARQAEVVAEGLAEEAAEAEREKAAGLPWGWIAAAGAIAIALVLLLRRRRKVAP